VQYSTALHSAVDCLTEERGEEKSYSILDILPEESENGGSGKEKLHKLK
jgi:hypothetical protein